ncbi:MAG: hypothetical protein LBO65_04855, partial [Spirochaetaceae bacterium]|nr:hypothetical protein [Spirochaetaceae bacterium]
MKRLFPIFRRVFRRGFAPANLFIPLFCALVFLPAACSGNDEMSLDEYNAQTAAGLDELLAKTTAKPWKGEPMVPGKIGGTWNAVMTEDPKSFN